MWSPSSPRAMVRAFIESSSSIQVGIPAAAEDRGDLWRVPVVSVDIQRRETVVDAVASIFDALSAEDLRMRFGSGGRSGVDWLLAELRSDRTHRAFVARDGE